jgi:hypothetical protein
MLRSFVTKTIACLAVSGLSAAAVSVAPVSARPLMPAEQRVVPYTGNLPTCDDPGVLGVISSRFSAKESEYWGSSLQIARFDHIGEAGYRVNGPDYIPRRYCAARALLNDGRTHQVTYWIGENLGIIGISYGVEWCVAGLDRNWAYAPNCRAARP